MLDSAGSVGKGRRSHSIGPQRVRNAPATFGTGSPHLGGFAQGPTPRARCYYGRPAMNNVELIEKSQLRDDIPGFRPGDTVKVHVRVVEGTRERVQVFHGVVIRRQGGGIRETFTVRKISFGVGVERTFPVHSPSIAKLEIVSRGKVRRAKLYYLRDLRGKKARIKERRDAEIEMVTTGEPEDAEFVEAEVEVEGVSTQSELEAPEADAAEVGADATAVDDTPTDEPSTDEAADDDEPAGDEPPRED